MSVSVDDCCVSCGRGMVYRFGQRPHRPVCDSCKANVSRIKTARRRPRGQVLAEQDAKVLAVAEMHPDAPRIEYMVQVMYPDVFPRTAEGMARIRTTIKRLKRSGNLT